MKFCYKYYLLEVILIKQCVVFVRIFTLPKYNLTSVFSFMSFAPYLYFSFVFIAVFSILEVAKNFSHSVLLKGQFIVLLVLGSVVNAFLFRGQLSNLEISVVRLILDSMPLLVLNIALILYAYQIATWVFIVEGLLVILGAVLVFLYGDVGVETNADWVPFKFYTIASTSSIPLLIYRIGLHLLYFIFFIIFFLKISFLFFNLTNFDFEFSVLTSKPKSRLLIVSTLF